MKNISLFFGNLNRALSAKIPFGIIAFAVIIGFVLAGCGDGGGGGGGSPSTTGGTGPSASFWATNDVTDSEYRLTANKLAENSYCEVWVEQGSSVTQATATAIANEYTTIRSKNLSLFSKPVSAGGRTFPDTMALAFALCEEMSGKSSSKLTILLLDIKDGFKVDTDPFIAGYFAMKDFYSDAQAMQEAGVHSNERPIIYMDTYPGLSKGMEDFYSTIAHEMQHLMNFTIDGTLRGDLTDVWVNEGLSSAAEWNYLGKHVQDRIDWFKQDPTSLISQGDNFFVWDNYEDLHSAANLNDYATVYLFFQWLRLNGGGTGVYKSIMNEPTYKDYRAVLGAVTGYSSWPVLLEDWLKANYYKSSTYGYGSDSKLNSEVQIKYVPMSGSSIPLVPGEAVYSRATAYPVPASGTIAYRGLGASNNVVTSSGSSFTGALLTYNTSTSGTSALNGTITGVAGNIVASKQVMTMPNSLLGGGPYAISRGDLLRRKGRIEKSFDLTDLRSKLFKGAFVE